MGLFGGIKRAWGQITGATAAKQARRAGRGQARAIQRGAAVQRRQLPHALEAVTAGALQARGELGGFVRRGQRAAQRVERLAGAPIPGYRPAELTPLDPIGFEQVDYTPVEYTPPTAAEVAESPAVRFRMQEAERALQRRQAAAGRALGGGAQRELARYMQGLASQEYGAEAARRMQEAEFMARQQQFGAGLGAEQQRTAAQLALQRGGLTLEQQRLAEQQAQFAPTFARETLAQRLAALQGLTGMGFQAAGERAGIRERLGQTIAGLRTGSGAAQAAAIQAAGQARASGALAGTAARQQAMGQLMKLGGTLGSAYIGGALGRLGAGFGGGAPT